MDKNEPNFNYSPYSPYGGFDDLGFDPRMNDPMINPMMQYEQAYMYYRYLTCQMEYKIKCKEYERMTGGKSERRVE